VLSIERAEVSRHPWRVSGDGDEAGPVQSIERAEVCRRPWRRYEIYLTHMFFVLSVAGVAQAVSAQASSPTFFAWYALSFLLSVACGLAIARWYSEPLNRRLRARTENAPATALEGSS
jgi:hypothetical protein